MATFRIVPMVHNKRSDGRIAVSIRVTSKRKSAYVKTAYYVTDKDLRKGEVKDKYILADLSARIVAYERKIIKELGADAEDMDGRQIAEFLTAKPKDGVNLVEFGYDLADKRKADGRLSIANSYVRVLNWLCDYLGRKAISLSEFDRDTILGFIEYLKSDRQCIRKVRNSTTLFDKPPITDNTLVNYITNLKTIYHTAVNAADLDLPNPFRKIVLKKTATDKRVIPAPDLILILRYEPKNKYEQLAVDAFRLSFYLCGCNMADLYAAKKSENGRFEYERAKTRDRRADRAFMSIAIPIDCQDSYARCVSPEYDPFLFSFHKRYCNVRNFNFCVNNELSKICSNLGIAKVTTYYARYMWANIARNHCRVSKDDVAMALNHVGSSVTDIYLQRDFSIVDAANTKVCEFIRAQCRGTATQG